MEEYGKVAWRVSDVMHLNDDWSEEQARDFLERNQRYLRDEMVRTGYDAMLNLYEMES